jgi:LPXTG-motif cell wall-anchored protein
MSGRRYRCIVTDQNLDSVTSDEAVLTVQKALPLTGDNIDQTLMIFLIGIILLAAWFRISPRRKEENPSSKG